MAKTRQEQFREAWLHKALDLLRKEFSRVGLVLPKKIQLSCSWPSSSVRKSMGECWQPQASEDGVYQIFITPRLGRKHSVTVLDILVHELCHTLARGHKAPFQKVGKTIGLSPNPKWTTTNATPELLPRLNTIATRLGPYPHGEMSLGSKKKQTTRLLKMECTQCGCVIRVTRKWLDEYVGVDWPCPCGSKGMVEDMPK